MRRTSVRLVRFLLAGGIVLIVGAAQLVACEPENQLCDPTELPQRGPAISTDLIDDLNFHQKIGVSPLPAPAPRAPDQSPATSPAPPDPLLDDILRIRDAEQDAPESKLDRDEFSSALRRLIDEHRKAAQKIQIPLPPDERTDIDKKSAFDRWIGRPTPSRAAEQSRWGELPQLFPQTKPRYAPTPWIAEREVPRATTVPPPAAASAPTVDALRRSARHFDTLAADHEDAGQYDQADAVRATAEMLRHEARRLSQAPSSTPDLSPRY